MNNSAAQGEAALCLQRRPELRDDSRAFAIRAWCVCVCGLELRFLLVNEAQCLKLNISCARAEQELNKRRINMKQRTRL